jgi:hypothetical protein
LNLKKSLGCGDFFVIVIKPNITSQI